jgi:hypothetical protein
MNLQEAAEIVREDRRLVTHNKSEMYFIRRAEYELSTAMAAELDETPIDAEWLKEKHFSELCPEGMLGHCSGQLTAEHIGFRNERPVWEITTDTFAETADSRGMFLTYMRLWGIKL